MSFLWSEEEESGGFLLCVYELVCLFTERQFREVMMKMGFPEPLRAQVSPGLQTEC